MTGKHRQEAHPDKAGYPHSCPPLKPVGCLRRFGQPGLDVNRRDLCLESECLQCWFVQTCQPTLGSPMVPISSCSVLAARRTAYRWTLSGERGSASHFQPATHHRQAFGCHHHPFPVARWHCRSGSCVWMHACVWVFPACRTGAHRHLRYSLACMPAWLESGDGGQRVSTMCFQASSALVRVQPRHACAGV